MGDIFGFKKRKAAKQSAAVREEAEQELHARFRIERLTRIQKLHNYGEDWEGWKEIEEHKAFLNSQGYEAPVDFDGIKGYE